MIFNSETRTEREISDLNKVLKETDIQQKMKEIFNKLPQSVLDAFFSSETYEHEFFFDKNGKKITGGEKVRYTANNTDTIRELTCESGYFLDINIYKDFFCLFDECEKVTQDIDYRRKIAQPIHDFFQFKDKAFVSATPLPMSHVKFEEQNFQKIKIKPDYDYKRGLELIVTNSYYRSLKRVLEEKKDSKHVCIFFNVTDGIHEIIENLEIKDYKIFCSQKSVEKLEKRGVDKAHSQLDYPFAKYNFFTCRFYSGLDIVLKNKPDIIMLTDFNSADWTMIDPFTEAIQIQGRFRKKKDEDVTYNSLTHISTINPEMTIKSKEEIDTRINQFLDNYNLLKGQHDNETDDIKKEAIFDDIETLHCQELMDELGNINPFSIDNLYNEERVKSYYVSAQSLSQAYEDTGFFHVTLQEEMECVGEDDLMKLSKTKQNIEKRRILVHLLEKIHDDFKKGTISKEEKNGYIRLLRGKDSHIIDAYMKIGKAGIEKSGYKRSLIDKAIQQYDKEQAEILRFSFEVLNDIQEEFEMGVYVNKNEIKDRLQAIYGEHGIKYKVTQDTIKDYYDVDNSGSIKGGSYKLTAFNFNLVGN